MGGAALLGLVYLTWHASPAWLFTAAIIASTFNSNWDAFGFPSGFAPDRVILLAAILALLLPSAGARTRPAARIQADPPAVRLDPALGLGIGNRGRHGHREHDRLHVARPVRRAVHRVHARPVRLQDFERSKHLPGRVRGFRRIPWADHAVRGTGLECARLSALHLRPVGGGHASWAAGARTRPVPGGCRSTALVFMYVPSRRRWLSPHGVAGGLGWRRRR